MIIWGHSVIFFILEAFNFSEENEALNLRFNKVMGQLPGLIKTPADLALVFKGLDRYGDSKQESERRMLIFKGIKDRLDKIFNATHISVYEYAQVLSSLSLREQPKAIIAAFMSNIKNMQLENVGSFSCMYGFLSWQEKSTFFEVIFEQLTNILENEHI